MKPVTLKERECVCVCARAECRSTSETQIIPAGFGDEKKKKTNEANLAVRRVILRANEQKWRVFVVPFLPNPIAKKKN